MPRLTEGTDAANSPTTSASMSAGDYFFGTLSTTDDSDWIKVTLEAGQTYSFAVVGVGALTNNLGDPYLFLRDGSGNLITFDDDGGPGRNSTITFTASSSGAYFLDVQSWNNSQAGDYGVSMTSGTQASYDIEMAAGNLVRDGLAWTTTPATGVSVTWSIRNSGTEPGGGNAFIIPSSAQAEAIQSVMAYIAAVSGLTLT